MSSFPKHCLDDLATIQSGFNIPSNKSEYVGKSGRFRYVQVRDFDDEFVLHDDNMDYLKVDSVPENHMLQNGDVLFLSRGRGPLAWALTYDLPEAVIANYFYVLRPKDAKSLPTFLAWYINQPESQAYFDSTALGSSVKFITIEVLRKLKVVLPPIEMQVKIVELDRLSKKFAKLSTEIIQKRQAIIQKFCMDKINQDAA